MCDIVAALPVNDGETAKLSVETLAKKMQVLSVNNRFAAAMNDGKLKKIVDRIDFVMVLTKCLAVLLSYLVGAYLTGHFHLESRYFGAMLASIAAIVVMQNDIKTTIKSGWLRVLGTFIGAVLAVVYLLLFRFTLPGMIVMVFVLASFCMLIRIPDDGRIAIMTLIVVLLVSKYSPHLSPYVNGLLRFVESAAGAIIGIGLYWLVYRFRRDETEAR